MLVANDTTKECHLCVEHFAISLLPKCRNAETSNMFRSKPNHCISSGKNKLLVSNDTTKERHLCVERFTTSFLAKCRSTKTSNMFLNKHNHCIAREGICCSFPLLYLRNRTSQNRIASLETISCIFFIIGFPNRPQRCSYANRRVRTTYETNDHTKRKVLCCIPTKEVQGTTCEQYCR